MAKPTRLTYKIVERIAELKKARMSWRGIASAIGVHENTLYDWRKKSEEAESGVFHALKTGIEQAEAELYELATQTIFKDAFEGHTKNSTKVVIDENGNRRVEEKTEEIAPNSALALKILERLHPEIWQPTRLLKIDWKDAAKSKGIDSDKLETDFRQHVAETGLPEITEEAEEDAGS